MKSLLSQLLIYVLIAFTICQNPNLEADPQLFLQFQNFIKAYNKTYNSGTEWMYRLEIFKDNFQQLQTMLNKTQIKSAVGITDFFDLTPQEYKRKYLNLDITLFDLVEAQKPENSLKETLEAQMSLKSGSRNCTETENLLRAIPVSLDWRTRGAVGPVRNQGSCGCCWAFSTVSNLLSRHFLKYGVLENFSEEMLLDCDTLNSGCNGGLMKNAFIYLKDYTSGAVRASDYPYTAVKNTCAASTMTAVTQVTGYTFAGTLDEDYIAQMLVNYGPLAVAINADNLQYYYGGILDLTASQCNPYGLNHAVNLVGYGEENGIKFWIVRNSWGTRWGEAGYFRIARGKGTCGINRYVITSFVR